MMKKQACSLLRINLLIKNDLHCLGSSQFPINLEFEWDESNSICLMGMRLN